jgi:hypothetical protein
MGKIPVVPYIKYLFKNLVLTETKKAKKELNYYPPSKAVTNRCLISQTPNMSYPFSCKDLIQVH